MDLHIEPVVQVILSEVKTFLGERNINAYLVGGFVRDSLLGRSTADLDIALEGNALEVAQAMADAFGGTFVLLDAANGVGRVVLPETRGQWHIDLSTISGSIYQDLARRDFTINAIAIDLAQLVKTPEYAELIDPFNGRDDLKQNLLRATTESVFEADSLRLLRAVRLAAELDFTIDRKTEAFIISHANLISGAAGERVREELLRILAAPRSGYFVRYLDRLGLLTVIIPELERAKGVVQPPEHHWDVFGHSLETVGAVDFLLRRGYLEYADDRILEYVPWSEKLKKHFGAEVSEGSTRASLLKIAGLLHDISKPETKFVDENGRLRFFGHADLGADTSAVILERLRFSSKESKLVEIMVRHHLRPLQTGHDGEMPTHRAIYRYFRDTGDAAIDTLFLSLADHLSARGPELDLKNWDEHARLVDYILTRRFQQESLVTPPKLIDGDDLINTFGISPGPEIGKLLEEVREAQAAGEINNREEALTWIKRIYYGLNGFTMD